MDFFSVVIRAYENKPMPEERMFEQRDSTIASRFCSDTGIDYYELSKYPVILTPRISG